MGISRNQLSLIKNIIKGNLRKKLLSYHPETEHMPFHYRLLGKDKMALYSFIHSINTMFRASIYEPVAKVLAKPHFRLVEKQYKLGNRITKAAQEEIQNIIDVLSLEKDDSSKIHEIERIREVCQKGEVVETKSARVDIIVESFDGQFHLFDLKTAKPNKSDFKKYKRTLLEWIGKFLIERPDASVQSYLAIPYNPYEPKQYERWTMKKMFDEGNELKVASEFWDFIGKGNKVYDTLLACFEEVGIEMYDEIDSYFGKYK